MKMSVAAEYMQAELIGGDADFAGVSIDSRNVDKQNLFLAIKGPNHDAHDYVEQVDQEKVAGYVLEKAMPVNKPQLIVKDTRLALGSLAKCWRTKLNNTQIVAVTGSNGKTTVKEMLLSILSQNNKAIATKGNLNNDLGMPLTLLSVDQENKYAVLEMGASHAGEIDYMARIASADVVLVNNAGPAHLEGFGSIEGVAKAKGEIYEHLSNDGVAIINLDDKYSTYWQGLVTEAKRLTFSLANKEADVLGQYKNEKLSISFAGESVELSLPLLGKHNAMNAMATAATCLALKISLNEIKSGLELMQAVKGRLYFSNINDDNILIDDTYNANVASFKAAIDVVSEFDKKKSLVMGAMAELGEYSEAQHAEVGEYARQQGFDELLAYGEAAQAAVSAFGEGAKYFDEQKLMQDYLQSKNYKNRVFLVKGSRATKMENIVAFINDRYKKNGS